MTGKRFSVALAGQPNCGKSTVFNALSGARQHIANYPGVTVEKKSAVFTLNKARVELVDLPGTYSLTSYSLEERVTRDFLLNNGPDVVVNVADASNIKRNLYLTFQLMEMGVPVVLNLNMMDVVRRRNMEIDAKTLSSRLKIPVVPTAIKSGEGKKDLIAAIDRTMRKKTHSYMRMDYGKMEPFLAAIEKKLSEHLRLSAQFNLRWLSVKLMEADESAFKILEQHCPDQSLFVEKKRAEYESFFGKTSELHIAHSRYRTADRITRGCVKKKASARPLTDRVDKIVCNRYLGPIILLGVIYALYHLSIVEGYKLTAYTWPILAKLRAITASIMPDPGFIVEPISRGLALWFVDSINALLNYIPIFFILFALIAILEDIGYMPRMAFILDRIFQRFGLHGQSTLPMVLGGIYVGGCAVPGVMSTKGIPDERSRLATILIIPLLNCLAKVPLYILLVNIYFAQHKGLAMLFISTITILIALPVAKVLSLTLLKDKETAPFIMEMPPYHLPTLRGVLGLAVERVWLFIRKIITIVAAVAIILFVLLQFPGLSKEKQAQYDARAQEVISTFFKKTSNSALGMHVKEKGVMELILFQERYKNARAGVKDAKKAKLIDQQFIEEDELFFKITKPKKDKDAKKVKKAFRKVVKARKKIIREIKAEKINNSYLGSLGHALEPVTKYAGFDWSINVALLSAFAAKESTVATLGAIYLQDAQSGDTLEQSMKQNSSGITPLHALALMLFMALYPPCIATTIMVKLQTGSVKWMLFSVAYPIVLGVIAATLIFTGGSMLGLTGFQAMFAFYGLVLSTTIVLGFVNPKKESWS